MMTRSAGSFIRVGKIECMREPVFDWGGWRRGRGDRDYRHNLGGRPSIVRRVSVRRIACVIVINTCRLRGMRVRGRGCIR